MTTTSLDRPQTREARFTNEEVDRALVKLIQCNGAATRAAIELRNEGWHDAPTEKTIRAWSIDKHATRYLELHDKIGPELDQRAIAYARENMAALAHKISEGVQSIDFAELEGRDKAAAVKNLATAQALQNDKILGPLTGRPTHVVENRTATQIVEAMTSRRWLEPAHVDAQAEVIDETPQQQTTSPAVLDSPPAEPRGLAPEAPSA